VNRKRIDRLKQQTGNREIMRRSGRPHRGGDNGQTVLPVLGRIAKDHPRLEACGSLDELNCAIGELAARIEVSLVGATRRRVIERQIKRIQGELFHLGSLISAKPSREQGRTTRPDAMVRRLEDEIEAMEADLPVCKGFILPGGNLPASAAHVARAICRRAERCCVAALGSEPPADAVLPYLNRLGNWLFALARYLSKSLGCREEYWQNPTKSRLSRSP